MRSQKKIGVLLSYASEAVKILSNLIYTPVMLRLLGQSEYGLYQLVHSVVSYLGLLSFGFTASYIRFYSRFRADNDETGVYRLNGMYMTVFLIIAGICLLCGGIMITNIHAIFADGLTESEYVTAKILMIFMIINLAVTFPNSIFSCIVAANEKFFFSRMLVFLQNLFNPFLTLPLLIMGYGSVAMVCVTTVLTFARFFANMYFCFVKLKAKFIFNDFDLSLFKSIGGFTFFIFLNQIIDQINWSVDKFLLGRMVNSTAVAVYGVGGLINTMYLQLATSISSVFVPQVNKLVSESNDNKQLSELFTRIGRVQFILLSLVLSGFIFFGETFIYLWGGKEYSESYWVALCLITPSTVSLIQNIGIEIQRAKNKHQARSVVYFCIAICNVFISIFLIKLYGVVGAALGTTISLFFGNILFMNWYYYKHIQIDILFFWKNIIKFVPAFILPIVTGLLLIALVKEKTIVGFVSSVTVYLFVYCTSMWLFGMNDYEKDLVLRPLRKLLRMR